jgi:hypothetical protein
MSQATIKPRPVLNVLGTMPVRKRVSSSPMTIFGVLQI